MEKHLLDEAKTLLHAAPPRLVRMTAWCRSARCGAVNRIAPKPMCSKHGTRYSGPVVTKRRPIFSHLFHYSNIYFRDQSAQQVCMHVCVHLQHLPEAALFNITVTSRVLGFYKQTRWITKLNINDDSSTTH